MRKISCQFFIIFLLMLSTHLRAQHVLEGLLYSKGGTGGVDWIRPSVFTKTIPVHGAIKLQSRFIWNGSATIPENDHAIVAFGQGSNKCLDSNECWHNSRNEYSLLRYGVGAHVSHQGLTLELWFNPGNLYQGSAYIWNSENICGIGFGAGAIPHPQLCLSTSSSSAAYLTSRPQGWFLEAGRAYWLRIKVTATSTPDWYTLEASLLDYAGGVVQTAKLNFRKSDYFPLGSSVDGILGRAAGNADINFFASDDGF